jgi:nitrogen regulatory protein P-II 2
VTGVERGEAASARKARHHQRGFRVKYIFAIIQPQRLKDVRAALARIGIDSLIVQEVARYGTHEEHTEYYRGAQYEVGFMSKVRIEVFTSDDGWEAAVKAISESARTGNIGDGRIFVTNLEHTIQVKTGRMDAEATSL